METRGRGLTMERMADLLCLRHGGYAAHPASIGLMFALAVAVTPVASADLAYDSFVVDTGEATTHTLLHGRLTGGGTDDLIVFRHYEDVRQMAVYSFDGSGWTPIHVADVPPDVIFVDMMELGGEDRLLMFRRDHLEWLDPESWTRVPLIAASTIYQIAPLDVPEVSVATDLNGDGLDDVALPGFDGYTVWLQQADGGLSPPVGLNVDHTARTGFRTTSYRARDIYQLDYDGDSRSDLAFWHGDGLVVYRGTNNGFATAPVAVAVPVAVLTDDVTVSIGFGGTLDQTQTMLMGVADFNGDGVDDIATGTMDIGGLFDQSTSYDFHFGQRRNGTTVFQPQPDTSISADGIQGVIEQSDFDGDGGVDFGLFSFKLGIGSLLGALMTGTVGFNVDFYAMGQDAYPDDPNVRRRVRVRLDLVSGRIAGNWVAVGDLTGDGRQDLVVQVDASRFEVYPGTGDERLFAKRPEMVEVDLSDEGNVELADLNGDGRDDMFMVYRPQDDIEYRRVGVALSR